MKFFLLTLFWLMQASFILGSEAQRCEEAVKSLEGVTSKHYKLNSEEEALKSFAKILDISSNIFEKNCFLDQSLEQQELCNYTHIMYFDYINLGYNLLGKLEGSQDLVEFNRRVELINKLLYNSCSN